MIWQEMNDAPTSGQVLLDVGLPWAVVGHFNPHDQTWVYAMLNAGLLFGELNDHYFENEHEAKPKAWMPMPDLQRAVSYRPTNAQTIDV